MTPTEALDAVHSRLEAYEAGIGNYGLSPEMDEAITTLHRFITQVEEHGSEDLEWGEPGDCWERMNNDTDLRQELVVLGEGDAIRDDKTLQEAAIRHGLGRHYGDPHCIWCLQAE